MSTEPKPVPEADTRVSALLDAVERLTEQNRSIVESLRAPAPPQPPTALSADQVRSLIDDALKRHQASSARSAAREAFNRSHLSDLPEAYRRLLPDTDDAAALAEAEQSIRRQFREDLKSVLRTEPKAADKTGTSGIGEDDDDPVPSLPPSAAIDYSKLSPLQQIAAGLKSAAPARVTKVISSPAAAPANDDTDPLSFGAD